MKRLIFRLNPSLILRDNTKKLILTNFYPFFTKLIMVLQIEFLTYTGRGRNKEKVGEEIRNFGQNIYPLTHPANLFININLLALAKRTLQSRRNSKCTFIFPVNNHKKTATTTTTTTEWVISQAKCWPIYRHIQQLILVLQCVRFSFWDDVSPHNDHRWWILFLLSANLSSLLAYNPPQGKWHFQQIRLSLTDGKCRWNKSPSFQIRRNINRLPDSLGVLRFGIISPRKAIEWGNIFTTYQVFLDPSSIMPQFNMQLTTFDLCFF